MSEEFMMSGDPESVRAVERWIRSDVLDALGDCIAVARRAQALDYTYWDGAARDAFSKRIRSTAQGANTTYDLLDGVAALLGETADSVGTVNAAVQKSMSHVKKGGLEVKDGWVVEPDLNDYIYPGSENTRTGPGGENEASRFESMAEHYRLAESFADKATREVESTIKKYGTFYNNNYDFLIFAGVQYVNDTAKQWAIRSGSQMGLTWRLVKVGGPLIQIAGAIWSVYTGERPEKVFLSTGIGLTVGAVTFVALAPATVPAALVATAISSAVSIFASEGVAALYDELESGSKSSRARLKERIKSLEAG